MKSRPSKPLPPLMERETMAREIPMSKSAGMPTFAVSSIPFTTPLWSIYQLTARVIIRKTIAKYEGSV